MTPPRRNRRAAFTLIEIALLLLFLAFVAVAFAPGFSRGRGRSRVSRVQADLRSMATALASYYADNGVYPVAMVYGNSKRRVANSLLASNVAFLPADATVPGASSPHHVAWTGGRPTFAISGTPIGMPGGFASLTTPISYITSYFNDPFSPGGQTTFSYLPDRSGWILSSESPSGRSEEGKMAHCGLAAALGEQFTKSLPGEPFDGTDMAATESAIRVGAYRDGYAYLYDPTNGAVSEGSIARMMGKDYDRGMGGGGR